MTRYIIRRLLQAIPLLFIISMILFVLMQNMGDPLATMGGRTVTRSADRERLTRQLGLDKPIYMQYLYWLIGNDWTKADLDGDGVPETPGTRKGVLRGDFGTSLVNRGVPVTKVIGDRLPNTLAADGGSRSSDHRRRDVDRHIFRAAPVFHRWIISSPPSPSFFTPCRSFSLPWSSCIYLRSISNAGGCLTCRRLGCSIRTSAKPPLRWPGTWCCRWPPCLLVSLPATAAISAARCWKRWARITSGRPRRKGCHDRRSSTSMP